MRQCADRCRDLLSVCGADTPLAEAATAPGKAATRHCTACGAELVPGARFCGQCGSPNGTAAAPPSPDSAPEARTNRRPWLAAAIGAAVLLVGILFWVNRYAWLGLEPPVEPVAAPPADEKTMYATTQANLRDRATVQGSAIVGKLPRGTAVRGVLELGEDGTSEWFRISESGHYVSAINLSESRPPALARTIGRPWFAPGDLAILAQPQPGSAVLATASPGEKFQLVGLTAGGFGEVLLEKGGVGYFDASGIDIEAGSAQPIDVAFVPQGCGFGREVQMLLRKLGQDAQARAAADPDAPAEIEGPSLYLSLTRSWMGLRVGGIGQHYEAVSIYFREPPARVIEVLSKSYPIAANGDFAGGEDIATFSSIQPTQGEESRYGASELTCGV